MKYTHECLQEVFNKVCDPDDWKAPIFFRCRGESVNVVVEAIKYFTATNPEITLNLKTMTYAIFSPGYRAGPARDH